MGNSAIRRPKLTLIEQTSVVPNAPQALEIKPRWHEKAKEFAVLVKAYSAEDLSDASGCTVEAAKLWKRGRRFPNGTSLLALGQVIPRVRDWVIGEMNLAAPEPAAPPQRNLNSEVVEVIARLQVKAQSPGEIGAQARAMLAVLVGAD